MHDTCTRIRRTRARRLASVATVTALLTTAIAPAIAAPTITPIADGFVSPLGLAAGDDGSIYVAEAFLGQLTRIDRRGERTSVAVAEGEVASPGVDARGRDVVFTLSVFPEEGEAPDTTVNRLRPNGTVVELASLQAFEEAVNPDGDALYGFVDLDPTCAEQVAEHPFVPAEPYLGIVESNPYAVAIDGGDVIVADAAGNSIVRVRANGTVSALAVLPPIEQTVSAIVADDYGLPECTVGSTYLGEPVPTDVEVGPDGHYYVTALPGFPEQSGAGAVFRVHRRTGAVSLVADGLTYAVDLAVSRDGTIYVAELVTDLETFEGRISRIVDGRAETVVAEPFLLPGAIEIVRTGQTERIYATFGGLFADDGWLGIVTP